MSDLGPLGDKIVGYTKAGRPIVKNPDGTYSTERTVTMQFGETHVNLPTMYGGKAVSEDEAVALARKHNFIDPDTNQPFPSFRTKAEAEAAAKKRTKELGEELKAMGLY